MKVWNEQVDTDILSVEPDEPLQPHRLECVGQPAGPPPLKLADLLVEEPDNADSGEIDTGPAVGNEVW